MIEMFCRLGVPRKLDANQGSQFVGYVMKYLYEKIDIERYKALHTILKLMGA